MLKRSFDILASLFGIILLAPLFILISLLILLDSPGPIFFRQFRVGRYGKPFRIHKFRTMSDGLSSNSKLLTTIDDKRITRVGSFLRKYKLDELPQLIDVFFGKMSIVGPRPEVLIYVNHYPSNLRDLVLSVRPGITDPASLFFRNESALLSNHVDPESYYINFILPSKCSMSCEYIRSATLWSDVMIIVRTFGRIVWL